MQRYILKKNISGINYNFVPIDQENVESWKNFFHIQQQQSKSDFERKTAESCCTIRPHPDIKVTEDEFLSALSPTYECATRSLELLKLYKSTFLFIAYVGKSNIDMKLEDMLPKIEMSMAVITSSHIDSSTHIGISRSLTYTGEKHPNIAMKLQGFASKAILSLYPEKTLMITTPTNTMLEMFVKEFKSCGKNNKIYATSNYDFSKIIWWQCHGKLNSLLKSAPHSVKAIGIDDLIEVGGFKNQSLESSLSPAFLNKLRPCIKGYTNESLKIFATNILSIDLHNHNTDDFTKLLGSLDVD